jgi:opacity protein-like surface antigen
MWRFSRSASVAGLVCAFLLVMDMAAFAQGKPQPWQTAQRYSWVPIQIDNDSWTGLYGGVQFGGSFSTVRTNEFITGTDIKTNSFLDAGQSAFGGFNIGYDWQVRPNLVVGVFSNVNFMHDQVRHDFTGGFYIGATMDTRGSAQARVGFLAFPNVLLFVNGGVAFGNDHLEIDFGGPETNESRWVTGWTFGGGVEVKLPRNVINVGKSTSVFLDYSHISFDTLKLVMPAASPRFDYTWQRETNVFEAGWRIRF